MHEPASSGLAGTLGPIARLSWGLLHPCDVLGPAVLGGAPLTHGEVRSLCAEAAFAKPMRKVLLPEGSTTVPSLSLAELESLSARPDGRLALSLAGASADDLRQEALAFAAAAMQQQILAAVGKSSRLVLKSALGPDAFGVATEQAPTLYKTLAVLGDAGRFRQALATDEIPEVRRRFVSFGMNVLYGFVLLAAPKLGPLMAARSPCGGSGFQPWTDLQKAALPQFKKLGNRRLKQWPATTD